MATLTDFGEVRGKKVFLRIHLRLFSGIHFSIPMAGVVNEKSDFYNLGGRIMYLSEIYGYVNI